MKLTSMQHGAAFALLVFLSFQAGAHTLFLKPDSLYLSPGDGVAIPLINGTFVKSENRVSESRITDGRIVTPDGQTVKIADDQWDYEGEDLTILRSDFKQEGTHVIGVGTRPMMAYMTPDEFNFYLRYEWLEDDLKERKKLGEDSVGAAEKYAKFAKAVVQVGQGTTENFSAELGHPLEIVPLVNPAGLQVGEKFSVRILEHGQPLAGELIFATHEGHHIQSDEGIVDESIKGRTDENGEFEFTISDPGRWYVRLIDLRRTGDSEHWYSNILVWLGVEEARVPYESLWATLTFEIR